MFLHGAIVALVTPMTEKEELNEAGLRALVKEVIYYWHFPDGS